MPLDCIVAIDFAICRGRLEREVRVVPGTGDSRPMIRAAAGKMPLRPTLLRSGWSSGYPARGGRESGSTGQAAMTVVTARPRPDG